MTKKFKKIKKVLSSILLATMMISYVPAFSLAADGDAYLTGEMAEGDNVSNGNINNWAGTFFVTIEPDDRTAPSNYRRVYCVDFHTNWAPGELHYAEGDISQKEVVWILNNYYPSVPSKPDNLNDNQRASAVQLAIWHFTDGLDLTETTQENDKDVFNAAREIISLAETAPVPQTPSTLNLTVPNEGFIGEKKIITVEVLDQNGSPIGNKEVLIKITKAGQLINEKTVLTNTNGIATLEYTASTAGEETIEASVEYVAPAGLRWARDNAQILIMAEQVPGVIRKEEKTTTWNPAVSGYKYHDLNANGVWDSGEPTIEGVEIILSNGTKSLTDTTDSEGFYLFENVSPGNYTLTENTSGLNETWYPSEVPGTDGNIVVGENGLINQNFGNYQKASITVCKYDDNDGNLQTTDDQKAVKDWSMTLVGKTINETQKTGENGCVSWGNLIPGDYSVTEENDNNPDDSTYWRALTNLTQTVNLQSGDAGKTIDFYNAKNGTISGHKYNSITENPIEGWEITLSLENGIPGCPEGTIENENCVLKTDKNGYYIFRNLEPGDYTITEEPRTGWKPIDPVGGGINVTLNKQSSNNDFYNQPIGTITLKKLVDGVEDKTWDLDILNYPDYVNGEKQTVVAGTYEISEENKDNYSFDKLTCTKDDEPYNYIEDERYFVTVDAGEDVVCTFENSRDTGSIQAYKFEDLNGNGDYDNGEPKMEWGIHIENQNDVIYANEGYLWENLPTGEYTVSEDTTNPDWVATTATSQKVTLEKGELEEVYFGNFKCGTISGHKYEDLNGDGIWQVGEPGIEDWDIQLSDGQTTKTDENGYYEFTVCEAGELIISEIIEDTDTWYQTQPGRVSQSYRVTIQSGSEFIKKDFGNTKYGEIWGIKYRDNDGDGNLDFGDLADTLVGWVFDLFKVGETEKVATATSDENGNFKFTNLEVGTSYYIVENTKPFWTQTISSTSLENPITISKSGFSSTEQQFANFENIDIKVCKFEDEDGNLTTTNDQTSVDGWEMTLLKDGEEIETKETVEGCVTWTNLEPGEYSVKEEMKDDWTSLNDVTHNFGEVTSGNNYQYDFLNFHNVKLSGYKFEDVNSDGVWDQDEPRLEGWKIKLSNGEERITDGNGYYEFENIKPGTYTLEEELKDGWYQTLSPESVTVKSGVDIENLNFGNVDYAEITVCKLEDTDGDLETIDDQTSRDWGVTLYQDGLQYEKVVVEKDCYIWDKLEANHSYKVVEDYDAEWTVLNKIEHNLGTLYSGDSEQYNFINFHNVKLSGYKFNDVNGNRIWNYNEPTLENWTINLMKDGEVVSTTQTNENGYYEFLNVKPGTYTLEEELKEDWIQMVKPEKVTIESGINIDGLNFGNFNTTNVGGILIKDVEKKLYESDELVKYAISISNTGPVTIEGVLKDQLPEGLIFNSASLKPDRIEGNLLEWDLRIEPYSMITIILRADIDENYTPLKDLVNGAVFDYHIDPALDINEEEYTLKDNATTIIDETVKPSVLGIKTEIEEEEEETGEVLSSTGKNIVPIIILATEIALCCAYELKRKKN